MPGTKNLKNKNTATNGIFKKILKIKIITILNEKTLYNLVINLIKN